MLTAQAVSEYWVSSTWISRSSLKGLLHWTGKRHTDKTNEWKYSTITITSVDMKASHHSTISSPLFFLPYMFKAH